MRNPNRIRTESARIPNLSIEVPTRHSTSRNSGGAIHASRLTSANPAPVDNADATTRRPQRMDARFAEFGGGW